MNGKSLVFVSSVDIGYKLKIFLDRFSIKAFVLNSDHPKNARLSLINTFRIGHFDIMILVHGVVYPEKLKLGDDILNSVNFDFPSNYNEYKTSCNIIDFDNGSVLSFTNAPKDGINKIKVVKKLRKKYGNLDMQCLPIEWSEVNKLDGRVGDVLSSITGKTIRNHKQNEVKKQLLQSKKLRDYFKDNEQERDILRASLAEENKFKHQTKSLMSIPDYCRPKYIIAPPKLENKEGGKEESSAYLEELFSGSTIKVIANLKSLGTKVPQNYKYSYEDPKYLNHEQLEVTSGRKLWKLKHKKRLRKGVKKTKDGYIGS